MSEEIQRVSEESEPSKYDFTMLNDSTVEAHHQVNRKTYRREDNPYPWWFRVYRDGAQKSLSTKKNHWLEGQWKRAKPEAEIVYRLRDTLVPMERCKTVPEWRARLENALRICTNGSGPKIEVIELKKSLRRSMKLPPEPVKWDVPDFFPTGAMVLIAGRRGHGKSYFLQCLGKAYTEGSEFLGYPICKKPFLYVTREGQRSLYDQRFEEIGFAVRKKINKGFVLWGPWNEERPPRFGEQSQVYLEWAKEFTPCAAAWDGFRRFFAGDENSSEVIDPVGQEVTSYNNAGMTAYLAAHRGKSKLIELRGSSAIEDMASVEYVLEAKDKGTTELRCVKNWYGEERTLLLTPH